MNLHSFPAATLFSDFGFSFPELLLSVLLIVAVFVLVGVLFQCLWNSTMPQVFGLKEITFWQGVRLILISGILFGGLHFGK